jgi:chorismate synthase
MDRENILSFVRIFLRYALAGAMAKGLIDQAGIEIIASAVLAVGIEVWSVYAKNRKAEEVAKLKTEVAVAREETQIIINQMPKTLTQLEKP